MFGFRADGETLVVRSSEGPGLIDWSTKTHTGRPSDFDRAARGAVAICISPDDDHLVAVDAEGKARWRSRTRDESGDVLDAFGDVSDCAFSPSGRRFALATDRGIAVFDRDGRATVAVFDREGRATETFRRPESSLNLPDVARLNWSTAESFVTFASLDLTTFPFHLFFGWDVARQAGILHQVGGAAALDVPRRQVIVRESCGWGAYAFDGKRLTGFGPPAQEPCFHVHVHEVALSPNRAFVAAAEGVWGGSRLVLQALP